MDNYQTPQKTQSEFLENLPRDVREAVNRRNHLQSSPFFNLPSHTTPPSKFLKIKNPFEAAVNEHLHRHIFSPSVFAEVKNPRKSDKFRWTIEEVSSLRPAQIDESTMAQFEQTSAEDDVHVQAKIEKYFSETHIVPSPWNQEVNQPPLLAESTSPPTKEDNESTETCTVWTQTVLSLPPKLPEEVEKVLLPYFSFIENQERQSVDLNSSLCRRLFHFEAPEESRESSVVSIHSEISAIGSPIVAKGAGGAKIAFNSSPDPDFIPVEISPIHNSTPRKVSSGGASPTQLNVGADDVQFRAVINQSYDEQPLSPIALSRKHSNQSFAQMDFSGHMSVDTSFNMAPENDAVDVQNNTNLSESPVRTNEFMESSCNWDIEYNSVSLNGRPIRRNLFEPKPSTAECMDISHLTTTPKSKIINSQRKKLSDSFKFSDSTSDEELHFNCDDLHLDAVAVAGTSASVAEDITSQNTQDTGYHTGTEFSHRLNSAAEEEEMVLSDISGHSSGEENWKQNVFASTPSKRYFSGVGQL